MSCFKRLLLLIFFVFTVLLQQASAYNCLVARIHTANKTMTDEWGKCLSRWQKPDIGGDGREIEEGQLKTCGNRTWFSNIHTWDSLHDCMTLCTPCLETGIGLGADAVTCYDRQHSFPGFARCMLGYNIKMRKQMKMSICDLPDESKMPCNVNPFIKDGHYHDLALPGHDAPALAEVIDVGCTLQKGVCMNYPLNGMLPKFHGIGQDEEPGDNLRAVRRRASARYSQKELNELEDKGELTWEEIDT